ncbi:MAG: ribosome maturation factor RimP [Pyrinomonadaceae bacterium]
MKHLVEQKIKENVRRVVENDDLELVRTNIASSKRSLIISIFIDKEGGVTHEDCVKVSCDLETLLETEDFIPTPYLLEVSSPGLERELYSLKDFERFAGKLAKVKTNVEINGQKVFKGRIIGVESEEIIFTDKTKGTMRFLFNAVAKANLEIDLEEEFKRNEIPKKESGK